MGLLENRVRHFVYQRFAETSNPPVLEEIMAQFGLSRNEGYEALKTLESQRGLALLKGTQRILMAWPFSAVATPFRVRLENGKEHFANCAWDAVAFHVMLEQAVEIDSFCHDTGERIKVRIGNNGEVEAHPPSTLVYLGLPAARWWDDVVNTCSNNMVFFASPARMEEWLVENRVSEPGAALSIEKVIQLSGPIYANRISLDYARPPADALRAHFAGMGLTGSFWEI